MAILAQGHFGSRLPTRTREVHSSFDCSFFWEAPRSARASGGVHLTRAHSDPIASAFGDPVVNGSGGVHRARSSRVRCASTSGGVPCSRASLVRSAGASAEFIAPSARTQFFSLSPASSDAETHFPIVTGTKSRQGIETPTSSLSRRRLVDEAGHVLHVQVERVMRASVALGVRVETHKKERDTVGGDSGACQ